MIAYLLAAGGIVFSRECARSPPVAVSIVFSGARIRRRPIGAKRPDPRICARLAFIRFSRRAPWAAIADVIFLIGAGRVESALQGASPDASVLRSSIAALATLGDHQAAVQARIGVRKRGQRPSAGSPPARCGAASWLPSRAMANATLVGGECHWASERGSCRPTRSGLEAVSTKRSSVAAFASISRSAAGSAPADRWQVPVARGWQRMQ